MGAVTTIIMNYESERTDYPNMKRMTKILSTTVVLACILLSAFAVSAAKPEVATMPSEQEIITTVGILGIMNGDYYGNLQLDNYVTRAEFTKIALCTSNLKDTVNKASQVAPFSDVKPSHWASGYIVTAVTNGYLKGYVDGSFKPDRQVTLEEAVTVMLRILGYSELDSGKYPDSQLAKYEELNLGNMITAQKGQPMTRRDCMYLAYNVLCAETKNGTVHCQSLGYTTDSNGRIDYLNLISQNMEGPVAVNADSSYTDRIGIEFASATFYRDGLPSSASELQLYDLVYYNRDIRTIWAYTDKKMGTVNSISVAGITSTSPDYDGNAATSSASDSSGSIVVDGVSYRLGNDEVNRKFATDGEIKYDDFVMLMLDKDGNVGDAVTADSEIIDKFLDEDDDRVALINSTLKGPYVLKSGETFGDKIPFELDGASIYSGTKPVSKSFVKTNDVYYYSEPFNSVWVYRDTATGFVTAISPSKENPTSITVGTKTYTLDGSTVKQQFSNFGWFEEDDFVTVLLGNGGTAVYATVGDIYDYANNNNDGVTYADLVAQSMEGPIVVKPGKDWEASIPFDISGATFHRNNSIVNPDVIKDYDVIYYSKAFTSVWIYTDKATGTFEAVSPNRISPTSVTVSGKSYAIESTGAAFALSNLGSYKFGDTITVLLGKDGGIVDVISASEVADTLYGFITAFGEGTYQKPNGVTYTADTITIMGIDTQTYTYEHEKYAFNKGDFVSVRYVDGKVTVSPAASGVNASVASTVNSLIATDNIADDAVLLDVYITIDSNSLVNQTVEYCKLYPSRLSGAKLSASDIYYAKLENGKIKTLILKDFTGDIHTYGLVTADRIDGEIGYIALIGGSESATQISTAYGKPSIGPAKLTIRRNSKGGNVTETYVPKNLDGVMVTGENFGRGYCISGGKTYNYASNVEFYIKVSTREFTVTTYDDIADGNYKITAYYDDTEENGGRVRVIIAE